MSPWRAAAIAAAVICGCSSYAGENRGSSIERKAPAVRIIALSPHLAEIAYAAGAGAQLIAVVRYSDYPPAAQKLPRVGDASRIDIERVLALKPDLVLGWRSGNPASDIERLQKLGFRVVVSEPRRLSDVARSVRTIGALAGTGAAADRTADAFDRELEALRARYSARPPVRVFYEIWHRPLLTVNGAHIISDVLTLCGGVNVFAGEPLLTPAVSLEAVVAAKPDVVLGGSSAASPDALAAAWKRAPVARLRELPVRFVPPDLIQRQTPRIAEGARAVCEHLETVRAAQAAAR